MFPCVRMIAIICCGIEEIVLDISSHENLVEFRSSCKPALPKLFSIRDYHAIFTVIYVKEVHKINIHTSYTQLHTYKEV